MNAKARELLLNNLSDSRSVLERHDDSRLPKGAIKFGRGVNNIVITRDSVQTNSSNPVNPGFHFGPEGSMIRHGNHLDLDGSYTKFFFKGGEQQLNPLGSQRASSTTDPLPTIVSTLRGTSDAFLNAEIVDLIKSITSL